MKPFPAARVVSKQTMLGRIFRNSFLVMNASN